MDVPETNSVFAWWMLSRNQKEILQQQRFSGRFGGVPGQSRYFWVQEGSDERGAQGAAKAGIRPTKFVERQLVARDPGVRAISDDWGFGNIVIRREPKPAYTVCYRPVYWDVYSGKD